MQTLGCRPRRLFPFPRTACLAVIVIAIAAPRTEAAPGELSWSGDLRLRYETDWDSQNAAGVKRADRERGRIRLRGSLGYEFDSAWSIGARVRTGSHRSQQSPHLTFAADNGGNDDVDAVADRYFLQYRRDGNAFWVGRNSLPFWNQNELVWDDDVTAAGIAGTYETAWREHKVTLAAGAFALPDGGNRFNGTLLAGQARIDVPAESGSFTFAAGFKAINGEAGARHLLNRNGARDYLIGELSARWQFTVADRPLAVGTDLFGNFEPYGVADTAPFPATEADETLGWVVSALWGQLREPGDWQFGYYLAHVETFAVNAAYAQDDWVRWGNGPQTDGSNLSGHEFRLSYVPAPRTNLVARLYLVEAITSVQDGKRFRLDFNWSF